jgi:hypothetical protein
LNQLEIERAMVSVEAARQEHLVCKRLPGWFDVHAR